MIRKITLYLVVLFSIFVTAQNKNIYKIKLIDADTELPIENVIATLFKTNHDYISNKDGLILMEISKTSKLKFAHSDYKTKVINSIDIKSNEWIIKMNKNLQEIEEIIITKKHPQKIFNDILEATKAKLTLPIHLKMYSREFFKLDGNYVSYNDGLFNYCLSGKPTNLNVDILVEQNRTIGFPDPERIDLHTLGYNLNDIIKNYYDFNYFNEVLLKSARKKYNFEVKSIRNNEKLQKIVISPKSEIEQFLYEYVIIYEIKSKLIQSIEYRVPEEKATYENVQNYKVIKGDIIHSQFIAYYKLVGDIYYLSHSNEEIAFEVKDKKGIKKKIEIKNTLVTTKHHAKFIPYQKEDIFNGKSLINRKDNVLTEYWEIQSGIVLTDDEKNIINSINN